MDEPIEADLKTAPDRDLADPLRELLRLPPSEREPDGGGGFP